MVCYLRKKVPIEKCEVTGTMSPPRHFRGHDHSCHLVNFFLFFFVFFGNIDDDNNDDDNDNGFGSKGEIIEDGR